MNAHPEAGSIIPVTYEAAHCDLVDRNGEFLDINTEEGRIICEIIERDEKAKVYTCIVRYVEWRKAA